MIAEMIHAVFIQVHLMQLLLHLEKAMNHVVQSLIQVVSLAALLHIQAAVNHAVQLLLLHQDLAVQAVDAVIAAKKF